LLLALSLPGLAQTTVPYTIWGDEGVAAWWGVIASLAVALVALGFSIWLAHNQQKVDARLQARQQANAERQEETDLFNEVVRRLDEAESRWNGVKDIDGVDREKFTTACIAMFRAVDYWYYVLDSVTDSSMRNYIDERYPTWKTDYGKNAGLLGKLSLPHLEKRIDAA